MVLIPQLLPERLPIDVEEGAIKKIFLDFLLYQLVVEQFHR